MELVSSWLDSQSFERSGRCWCGGVETWHDWMRFSPWALCPILQLFFEDSIDDAKYCGRLYGLGTGVAQKQNEDVDSAQEKMSILAIINNMQQWWRQGSVGWARSQSGAYCADCVYLSSSPRENASFEQTVPTICIEQKDFCFTEDKRCLYFRSRRGEFALNL